MAQFMATIQGQRGATSRLGGKKSGLKAIVNGWHKGIKVYASHHDGKDCFEVWKTGGSTGAEQEKMLLQIIGDKVIPVSVEGK